MVDTSLCASMAWSKVTLSAISWKEEEDDEEESRVDSLFVVVPI
jgi:hypothetical protein